MKIRLFKPGKFPIQPFDRVVCRAVACYGSTRIQRNSMKNNPYIFLFDLCVPFHRCKIFWGLCMIPFYGFTDYGHF